MNNTIETYMAIKDHLDDAGDVQFYGRKNTISSSKGIVYYQTIPDGDTVMVDITVDDKTNCIIYNVLCGITVEEAYEGQTAQMLCEINKTLELGGFSFGGGVVSLRIDLPLPLFEYRVLSYIHEYIREMLCTYSEPIKRIANGLLFAQPIPQQPKVESFHLDPRTLRTTLTELAPIFPKLELNSIISPNREDKRYFALANLCTRTQRFMAEFLVSEDSNFLIIKLHPSHVCYKDIMQNAAVQLNRRTSRHKLFTFYIDEYGRLTIRASMIIQKGVGKDLERVFRIAVALLMGTFDGISDDLIGRAEHHGAQNLFEELFSSSDDDDDDDNEDNDEDDDDVPSDGSLSEIALRVLRRRWMRNLDIDDSELEEDEENDDD